MKIVKSSLCSIRTDSRWLSAAAMCMGLSAFIRTVYYFGLINLRDLDGFTIVADAVLPLAVAAAFILLVKGPWLNHPFFLGGVVVLYGLNYLLIMDSKNSGVVAGVILLLYAAAFLVTCLGYIPYRAVPVCAGVVLMLFRLFVVDLNGYVFPLSEFSAIAYLPEASNLFGFLAVGLVAPAISLVPVSGAVVAAEASVEES